jgi:DNA polymerase-1
MKIIHEIPPPQPKGKFVGIDTEITGLNKPTMHRPTSGKFALLTVATDPDTVYAITDQYQLPLVFANLRETVHVYQHAKFDITHLRRWVNIEPRKYLWDTMLIDRIMYGGYYDAFSLEDLARRHLDMRLDKSLQKSFEDATELTREQIEYGAKDAAVTLQIALSQKKTIRKEDFNIWAKVDRPALWAFMDFMGFAINVAGWEALAEKNRKRTEELKEQFDFNPLSPQQVKKKLIEEGFARLPDTGEKTLVKWIRKYPNVPAREIAENILKCRKFAKRANTYGLNFIENHLEKDIQFGVDMIYTDYDVNKAETGRTASSDPNMQNIPVRDTPEYRECFIARPDNVLLICDYSQQEAAVLAHISQDKKMIEIINSGESIYIGAAKRMFDRIVKKGTKDYSKTKSTVLGTNYGMTPYGLADRENISVDEAEDSINRYYRAFPDAASWIIMNKKNKKYAYTVMGRRQWLNPYSSQCSNNAINSPMQGTAGDMMKMAMAKMHQNWEFPYPFAVVEETHDEIGLDVPRNHYKEIAKFAKDCMESVAQEMCPSVKIKADIEVGTDWSCKS